MKKLLLLGGSQYLLPLIDAAHKLGVYVITCDYLPENVAHKYADEYANVSIVDKEAVLSCARGKRIDGIMSFACDPGVVTAAYVAEKLGLPFAGSYAAVQILQDKSKFRAFLQEHGFNVPRHKSYGNDREALTVRGDLALPVMVKPVDSAGSKGVSRVDRWEDLPGAVESAFACSLSKKIIVEEYLGAAGHPSDSDCFAVDGKLVLPTFSDQWFDEQSANPFVPIGTSWPESFDDSTKQCLCAELQRLMTLLQLGTGIFNVETRLGQDGKPYIMECSPRGGGGHLAHIIGLSSGVDLLQYSILAALGEPLPAWQPVEYRGAWAEYELHTNRAGIFQKVKLAAALQEHVVEQYMNVMPGERVYPLSGANVILGIVILRYDTKEELHQVLQAIETLVQVVVEND